MSKSPDYLFDAPRHYYDFTGPDPVNRTAAFFEEYEDFLVDETKTPILEERISVEESSDESYITAVGSNAHSTLYHRGKLRRSISVGQINLDKLTETNDGIKNMDNARPHSSCTMKSYSSNSQINRIAEPKRALTQSASSSMTFAEAVLKFHTKTPKRFHTKRSPMRKMPVLKLALTKAEGPNLKTSQRVRPFTAISSDEQEKLMLEEAKKFQIRAHPVIKRVLRGPLKVEIHKKPTTLVEPFNLTRITKKATTIDKAIDKMAPIFRAQPIPKSLHHPFTIVKATNHAERKRSNNLGDKINGLPLKDEALQATSKSWELTGLNFEQRNKLMLQKKEDYIENFIRDEQKPYKFEAKPVPSHILRAHNRNEYQLNGNEDGSLKSSKNSLNEQDVVKFKARSPTVLTKKPFEVKYDKAHGLLVEPFDLCIEERLEARHEFDQYLKDKESHFAQIRKEGEDAKQKADDEAVVELRKKLIHKAQPVRHYKEVTIAPSGKMTVPLTPAVLKNNSKNKENVKDH